MPEIVCVECGNSHQITHQGYVVSGGRRSPNGVIRGVLTCHAPVETRPSRNRPCGGQTLFELTRNATSWAPGALFHEDISPQVSRAVRILFREAVNAFYGGAYKGVLALCRSAVELSLDERNVKGRDLFEKIQNAPGNILGSREKTWADASRLDGRDALHRLMDASPTQALSSLNTTILLINRIASAAALPASQSGPGSSEP
jgi:hypothetical protein